MVAAASAAANIPQRPTRPPVTPKKTQPMPKIAVGRNVKTEKTPSRDSQDDRHCEKARHARSGRPRCRTEEASPLAASKTALASAAKPKAWLAGNKPSGVPIPSKISKPKPAPDAVVKKTMDSAGCILGFGTALI